MAPALFLPLALAAPFGSGAASQWEGPLQVPPESTPGWQCLLSPHLCAVAVAVVGVAAWVPVEPGAVDTPTDLATPTATAHVFLFRNWFLIVIVTFTTYFLD